MHRSAIYRRIAAAMNAAKIEGAVPHDMRRTFVSILIAQGRDVAFVAGQIGDTVQTMLNTHGHMWDHAKHMDAARAQLDAEFGDLLGRTRDATA